jgi:putative methyltransferase (TIGR01177 family)
VTVTYVERSGESLPLATAETIAAAEALGGRSDGATFGASEELLVVELPDRNAARGLAGRLALARRCLEPVAPGGDVLALLRDAGRSGASAAIRRIGRPTGGIGDPAIARAGKAYTSDGGRIDLERPERRLWLCADVGGDDRLFEEIAPVDRKAYGVRRMPQLPFQRPVSLPPALARAAANLGRIRPGDVVLDPFLGTGALLAEAALLGARTVGFDRDPEMAKGALRNFAHLGVAPESIVVGDAGEVEWTGTTIDALVTDPPYGRASGTGGEPAAAVVARVVPRWAERVREGGRVVLVVPGGEDPLAAPWVRRTSISVRVHRSLTREFRVYERAAGPPSGPTTSAA